jgi:hypothetical protein
MFRVVVPSEFKGQLIWTLSMRRRTERVIATLDPTLEIFFATDPRNPNKAPRITGTSPDQVVAISQPVSLKVEVVDDGLPDGDLLTVRWFKYRGPGEVTFSEAKQSVRDGAVLTTARFSEPGTYLVQALVDDGSRSEPVHDCCWTTAVMTVRVNAVAEGQAK